MSIYSIMAFNAAHDQVQKNIADSQAIDAKRIQNQTDQESLDLNKKLDLAKVSQATNENTLNNYVGQKLTDNINKQYKAKQDQLDATSSLQDIAQNKAQQGAQQAASVADNLLKNDPDVQAHAQTLSGIMGAQGSQPTGGSPSLSSPNNSIPPMSMPDGSISGNPNIGATSSVSPSLPSIPGIAPVQGGASPQNVSSQVTPQVNAPVNTPPAPNLSSPQAPNITPQSTQPQSSLQQNSPAIDLSPVEQAFGMPQGSMWLNPSTMKPEISPIFTQKMEAQNRAQAIHDVGQQNYEDSREDRNVRTASTLMANAVKTGPIALQNGKVDQAIHARNLINQSYDPKTGDFNITQVPYGELGETLSSLLAGKVGSSDARVAAVKQKTAQGDLNTFLTYWNGKPSNATSQDAIKQTIDIIDRQGQVSEKERNNSLDKLKGLPIFNRLNDDDFQSIKGLNLGNSYEDILKDSPDKQALQQKISSYKEGDTRNINGVTYTRNADGNWQSQ